jgi:hypothetical protein
MANIFKLQENYLRIAEALADGELTPELEQELIITEEALQEKATSYSYVIKQMEYEAEIMKKEEQRIAALRKSRENAVERLKSVIEQAMINCGISEIKGETIKLSFRKSESVEIENENLIPAEFIVTKEVKTVSKTAIKDAIKRGETVMGAKVVVNQNLQIK